MKKVSLLLTFVLLVCGGRAFAVDEVFFVGGAPLDTYQPRVITALLTEAFWRNGIKFRAEHYPSARSLLMSDSGRADGELHRVYEFHEVSQGKYPNLVRIESQLMSIYLAVFSNRKDITIRQWSDMEGAYIGYMRGRQNVKQHLSALKDASIYPQNTEYGLFKMASDGRVDYAVSESFEGWRMLQQHPELQSVTEVGKLEETKIYAYMNKKHAKLAKRIAATLEDMKRDGSFQRIVDKTVAELLLESGSTN